MDDDIFKRFAAVSAAYMGLSIYRTQFLDEQQCSIAVCGLKPLRRMFLYHR